MYRTHTCGELRIENSDQNVTLAGWVQKVRNLGAMTFIDIRDRYGITQLVVEEHSSDEVRATAAGLGREYVIHASGKVIPRAAKNPKIPTGEIEVAVDGLKVLNVSQTPPFTIEDNSDGGDELRMKYRFLDLRRNPLKNALILRHRMAHEIRNYLDENSFLEIETPYLIKSTPEGARDFVVPSRMNPGEFYALPQSPQTFKQLLMVAKRLFKNILGKEFDGNFPRIGWHEAMDKYGSDKPDIRFGMTFNDITEAAQGKGFGVFDSAEYVGAICAEGCAGYTRKQLDELTEFVKRPQVGAKGMVYVRCEADGNYKSSVDKFYGQQDLGKWAAQCGAKAGDLLLILSGPRRKTQTALCELRLEMGNRLGLRSHEKFAPLWVVDFPLLEWDDQTQRFYAMHHPFTSPNPEDIGLFDTDPGKIRANAYDFVVNGVEVGGGSIRIFDAELQAKMFETLGFTHEEAENQFGFLMNAFRFGAPPHGGIAFGFDRWCALFGGADSIRDYIAFPKNNSGRDVMIDSPSNISNAQLEELSLTVKKEEK